MFLNSTTNSSYLK